MALLQERKRMAEVVAIRPTDTLLVMKGAFQALVARHPEVAQKIESTAAQRAAQNEDLAHNPERAARLKLMEGLADSTEVLVIDLYRCIRCNKCVAACGAVRGAPRIRPQGERFGRYVIGTACRQCRNPSCMFCPRGAITRDRSGEIDFDDRCVGCGLCARECQFGNITLVEREAVEEAPEAPGDRDRPWREAPPNGPDSRPRRRAVRCDLCRDRAFAACVHDCPTGALQRISAALFFARVVIPQ
jgi:Fe-S-cluster-containing hydrogenase component 2